jgi:predicted metal-binding protein
MNKGNRTMKIDFTHQIKERAINEIKSYFQPKVFIEYCKACKYYNKIWACPPYDADFTELLENYQYAYIIGSKLYIKDLGEDFRALLDKTSLEDISNEIYKAARAILDKKLSAIGDKGKDLFILLAGRCLVCANCTRENQLPCIYPEKMHLSLESIGFDVSSMCEDILEDKIQWAKESLPEYFILVSAILSPNKMDIAGINKDMASDIHSQHI